MVQALQHLVARLGWLDSDERGAVGAEYGVLVGVIAVGLVIIATAFVVTLTGLFDSIDL